MKTRRRLVLPEPVSEYTPPGVRRWNTLPCVRSDNGIVRMGGHAFYPQSAREVGLAMIAAAEIAESASQPVEIQ